MFSADIALARPRYLELQNKKNYIPRAPIFAGTFGLTFLLSKGINIKIAGRYLGKRPLNEDNSIQSEDYFIANLTIMKVLENAKFGFRFENLFNSKWRETQFLTTSRLKHESKDQEDIHFISGTPFNIQAFLNINF